MGDHITDLMSHGIYAVVDRRFISLDDIQTTRIVCVWFHSPQQTTADYST